MRHDSLRLGQVAEFYAGSSLPEGENWQGQKGGYLLARVSDMNRVGNEKLISATQWWNSVPGQRSATCPGGAIVIPKRGGAIGTNKKRIVERPVVLDPNLMAVKPVEDLLDLEYLYQWFLTVDLKRLTSGSSVPQLNKKDLSPLVIPLPPLQEQKRIAALLDQVDTLRTKRREAVSLLDDLAHSVFLDMFGDPVSRRRGWRQVRMGELLATIDSGKSPECLSRPASSDEWGVLKLGAITRGVYVESENKALPSGVIPERRHEIQSGDILFSRKNTPDLVAASAYVRSTRARLLMPDLMFRLVLADGAPVDRAYLHALLAHPKKRREIQALASGSAASMVNISKSKLLDVVCGVPPMDLQREFGKRLEIIEGEKNRHRTHLATLDELFTSLQHRAFSGTLWEHDATGEAA
ncbi:restriction endonuclease subunit S [Streptomyces sp. NPDC047046]|uniref:restriction endonuclease subunit S n=1 Tax=Streptomyces sp. NPDC047046 TaxID=3155378 RepID=UPI0033DB205D